MHCYSAYQKDGNGDFKHEFRNEYLLIAYRNASNKRPGRLLNFSIFRRGVYSRDVYSRGCLKEGGVY